ncbi:MAG: DUF192 domain-containing protein [Maribacter sp.]|nr:DUF192 domain-containing protein [Maribacter sp.]
MRNFKFALLLLVGLGCLQSCKEETKKVLKTEPIEFKKEGELSIYRQKVDTLIANINIEIAETDYETETGLMYRKGMAEDQGMLFIFPGARLHNFYMKNTEFPLDLIFINENLAVASFAENAKPFDETSLSSEVPVKYVLEVNAGLAQKWSLQVGDRVEFTRR